MERASINQSVIVHISQINGAASRPVMYKWVNPGIFISYLAELIRVA